MNLEMVTVFIVVFGLMIGSFLNVCIYRIPKKESIVIPRSHCPHCNHQLRVWENIPVISFLMLKGLCSSCKNKISFRYPIIELLTAILLLMAYFRFGLSFGKIAIGQRIPFGPFLSLGALLGLLWGTHILEWYLNLVF